MAPLAINFPDSWEVELQRRQDNTTSTFGNWRDANNTEAYILEGWGEGFMLGALFIMAIITIVNMKKGMLLHKMILLEVERTYRISC